MYLTLDVGNSNIVGAIFKYEHGAYEALHSFRLITPSSTTTDELALSIKGMLDYHKIPLHAIRAALFASVVPSLNHNITKLMQLYFNIEAETVTHEYFNDFTITYQDKESLGIDRLLNAKATAVLYGAPAIIIDFGTALTIDVLSAQTVYAGGLILPGVAVSLDALIQRTSQLPKVELQYPQKLLGNSTKTSIQNGIFFLYQTAVENIIKMLSADLPATPHIVTTGGLAPFITHRFKSSPQSVPLLTLIGLKILLDERAATSQPPSS